MGVQSVANAVVEVNRGRVHAYACMQACVRVRAWGANLGRGVAGDGACEVVGEDEPVPAPRRREHDPGRAEYVRLHPANAEQPARID